MVITYSEIIEYLNDTKTNYYVDNIVSLSSDNKFNFASTKNVIKNGFYYIERGFDYFINEISNSIVLTNSKTLKSENNTIIYLEKPQLVHYKLASIREEPIKSGIHVTAIVSDKSKISKSAYIGPFCIIEECEIGENVQLLSNIRVNNNTVIKKGTVIESNCVIGARGMAWIWDESGNRIMQPQTGGVIIEENCLIGTDVSIVRGSLTENTQIGNHTVIAHGTKIGHGSNIGTYVHIANNVSLAGNAKIGDRTFLGSACVVSSNVEIASNCLVGAGAVVSHNMLQEYATIVGVPARIIKVNNFENKPKGAPKPFKK